MKRIIAFFVLFLVYFLPPIACASTWTIAEKLTESVVYLESKEGSCTGFVIDDDRDFVLTAAHCDGAELFADQSPTKIVSKDVKSDLMVLYVKGVDRPALKLASKNPAIGEEVASLGFGYGLERPLFRVSHISDNKAEIAEISGNMVTVDSAFAPGQSGGPVVNQSGEVVMIVQMANDRMGLGRGAETIKSKVGKFFQKQN